MPGNDEKQKKLGENSSDQEREPVDSGDAGPADSPEKAGAPTWIVTFSDLMSLLMCFFVMLLSMSTVDVDKFKAMLQGLDEGLNTKQSRMDPSRDVNTITREQLLSSLRSQKQQITDVAKLRRLLKRMIMDRQVELLIRENQIVIRILQGGSFQAGKAELKKGFMPVAKKLRKALGSIEGAITVTGHTDDRPIKSKRFRSNWELASARSVSVVAEITKGTGLDAKRFFVRSYGSTKPRVPNDTAENRAKNRRIALIVKRQEKGDKPKLSKRKGKQERKSLLINYKNYDTISDEAMKQFLEKSRNKKEPTKTSPKKSQ